MRTLTHSLVALFASLSLLACSQTISGESVQGVDGGESLTCDDPNLTSCESTCVDTDVSPEFCGSCDNACDVGQGCSAGACVDLCDPGLVNCGGECIDPLTNGDFCGASGFCSGDSAGTDCGDDPCSGGVCVANRYIGSLPASSGRWEYGGTVGVAGAVEACRTTYATPTATVCTFNQLLEAQNNPTGSELVGATDNNGEPVTEWHILDANQDNLARQCINTDVANGGENVPWSYETAHLGQGSRFASLSAVAGTVSQVQDAAPSLDNACGASRFVPCCVGP